MDNTPDTDLPQENPNNETYEYFTKFIDMITSTAKVAGKYLNKLLIISVIISLTLSTILYGMFAQLNTGFFISLMVAFIPVFIIIFLRYRVWLVECLPEDMKNLEQQFNEISEKLKDNNMTDKLSETVGSKETGFRKRIKLLLNTGPILYEMKGQLCDIIKPDFFITVLAVANPAFGFILLFSVVPVVLWGIVTVILSIIV